jgi:hypothetical protein
VKRPGRELLGGGTRRDARRISSGSRERSTRSGPRSSDTLTAFESDKLPEEACGHRVSALQREIVSLETERGRLEAECDLAPSLPIDDLLAELRAALLRASEEQALEKLKQLLACVVDKIVVEGRDHIRPYYFVPGVLIPFPSRRRTGIEPAGELSPAHRFEGRNVVPHGRGAVGEAR